MARESNQDLQNIVNNAASEISREAAMTPSDAGAVHHLSAPEHPMGSARFLELDNVINNEMEPFAERDSLKASGLDGTVKADQSDYNYASSVAKYNGATDLVSDDYAKLSDAKRKAAGPDQRASVEAAEVKEMTALGTNAVAHSALNASSETTRALHDVNVASDSIGAAQQDYTNLTGGNAQLDSVSSDLANYKKQIQSDQDQARKVTRAEQEDQSYGDIAATHGKYFQSNSIAAGIGSDFHYDASQDENYADALNQDAWQEQQVVNELTDQLNKDGDAQLPSGNPSDASNLSSDASHTHRDGKDGNASGDASDDNKARSDASSAASDASNAPNGHASDDDSGIKNEELAVADTAGANAADAYLNEDQYSSSQVSPSDTTSENEVEHSAASHLASDKHFYAQASADTTVAENDYDTAKASGDHYAATADKNSLTTEENAEERISGDEAGEQKIINDMSAALRSDGQDVPPSGNSSDGSNLHSDASQGSHDSSNNPSHEGSDADHARSDASNAGSDASNAPNEHVSDADKAIRDELDGIANDDDARLADTFLAGDRQSSEFALSASNVSKETAVESDAGQHLSSDKQFAEHASADAQLAQNDYSRAKMNNDFQAASDEEASVSKDISDIAEIDKDEAGEEQIISDMSAALRSDGQDPTPSGHASDASHLHSDASHGGSDSGDGKKSSDDSNKARSDGSHAATDASNDPAGPKQDDDNAIKNEEFAVADNEGANAANDFLYSDQQSESVFGSTNPKYDIAQENTANAHLDADRVFEGHASNDASIAMSDYDTAQGSGDHIAASDDLAAYRAEISDEAQISKDETGEQKIINDMSAALRSDGQDTTPSGHASDASHLGSDASNGSHDSSDGNKSSDDSNKARSDGSHAATDASNDPAGPKRDDDNAIKNEEFAIGDDSGANAADDYLHSDKQASDGATTPTSEVSTKESALGHKSADQVFYNHAQSDANVAFSDYETANGNGDHIAAQDDIAAYQREINDESRINDDMSGEQKIIDDMNNDLNEAGFGGHPSDQNQNASDHRKENNDIGSDANGSHGGSDLASDNNNFHSDGSHAASDANSDGPGAASDADKSISNDDFALGNKAAAAAADDYYLDDKKSENDLYGNQGNVGDTAQTNGANAIIRSASDHVTNDRSYYNQASADAQQAVSDYNTAQAHNQAGAAYRDVSAYNIDVSSEAEDAKDVSEENQIIDRLNQYNSLSAHGQQDQGFVNEGYAHTKDIGYDKTHYPGSFASDMSQSDINLQGSVDSRMSSEISSDQQHLKEIQSDAQSANAIAQNAQSQGFDPSHTYSGLDGDITTYANAGVHAYARDMGSNESSLAGKLSADIAQEEANKANYDQDVDASKNNLAEEEKEAHNQHPAPPLGPNNAQQNADGFLNSLISSGSGPGVSLDHDNLSLSQDSFHAPQHRGLESGLNDQPSNLGDHGLSDDYPESGGAHNSAYQPLDPNEGHVHDVNIERFDHAEQVHQQDVHAYEEAHQHHEADIQHFEQAHAAPNHDEQHHSLAHNGSADDPDHAQENVSAMTSHGSATPDGGQHPEDTHAPAHHGGHNAADDDKFHSHQHSHAQNVHKEETYQSHHHQGSPHKHGSGAGGNSAAHGNDGGNKAAKGMGTPDKDHSHHQGQNQSQIQSLEKGVDSDLHQLGDHYAGRVHEAADMHHDHSQAVQHDESELQHMNGSNAGESFDDLLSAVGKDDPHGEQHFAQYQGEFHDIQNDVHALNQDPSNAEVVENLDTQKAELDQQVHHGDSLCFTTGTLIKTVSGEIPVEELNNGDEVLTSSGEVKSITWIGHQDVIFGEGSERPVTIKANALADGVPYQDLTVSAAHGLALTSVVKSLFGTKSKTILARASALVNGASIVTSSVPSATYWHVELEGGHDVVVANGAEAESFADHGERSFFTQATSQRDPRVVSDCLPRYKRGRYIRALRKALNQRSVSLGSKSAQKLDELG